MEFFAKNSIKDREVYLDNSATTKVFKESIEKAAFMMETCYGNPSSLHSLGISAEVELDKARVSVANLVGCNEEEIYFTSGGTEANNIAIFGTAKSKKRLGNHIVTTMFEHSSVSAPIKQLEASGFKVTRLGLNGNGTVSPEQVLDACSDDTVLLSIMSVNNETGHKFNVSAIANAVKRHYKDITIHCDGVQSVGKNGINLASTNIDLFSISGHKIHGPKGIGALYIKNGVRVSPLFFGGGQERNIRSGTESTPLAAALGVSAKKIKSMTTLNSHFKSLYDYSIENILKREDKCLVINSQTNPDLSVNYIINFSVLGIKSEIMLHHMAYKGVYLSSGSACAKGRGSEVLKAMGFSQKRIDSALRISFSYDTTTDDIDYFLKVLDDGIDTLFRN